jgi:hypothetical protein
LNKRGHRVGKGRHKILNAGKIIRVHGHWTICQYDLFPVTHKSSFLIKLLGVQTWDWVCLKTVRSAFVWCFFLKMSQPKLAIFDFLSDCQR